MTTRRAKIEIIFDILKAIQDKGGIIKPTHLLYKSNLSHQKMTLYVNELIAKGFIKTDLNNQNKVFTITSQGINYIQEYKRIKAFSDSFGL
jgi:predicted transcriptional regulator